MVLLALPGLVGCGASDDEDDAPAVPIERIPDDKPVIELTSPERKGVCNWARSVAREALPAPGTVIDCGGIQITMNATRCSLPDDEESGCAATVAAYEACIPPLMARIGEDPCQLLEILTDEAAVDFVESTPGCAGLGHCASSL